MTSAHKCTLVANPAEQTCSWPLCIFEIQAFIAPSKKKKMRFYTKTIENLTVIIFFFFLNIKCFIPGTCHVNSGPDKLDDAAACGWQCHIFSSNASKHLKKKQTAFVAVHTYIVCILYFPTARESFKFWNDASKPVMAQLSGNQPDKEPTTMSSVCSQHR